MPSGLASTPGLGAPVPPETGPPIRQQAFASPAIPPLAIAIIAGLAGLLALLLWRRARDRAYIAQLRADLATRDAAAKERERKDAFYRAYYDATPDNVFVLKVDGGRFTMEDCNLAHQLALGVNCEAILGKDVREILPNDVAGPLTALARRCTHENQPVRFEVDFGPESARRRWETRLAPIRDPAGQVTHVIGASRDITDRHELEEKLRQGQKMEAIGQLTGGIAHDFNNLLTVMIGNLDLLKHAREERRPTLIDNALRAIERARELTQKLLVFGRRQPLNPEPTDLKALIAGMDDMLMQSLRDDIRLELDLAGDLWHAEVDQAQFQVALINLAANARDAMPEGGVLRIKAANARLGEGEAFEAIAISVTDTGHGMAQDVLARAFDPFFTTKDVGKGTGLGLPQVYSFVQQSGGSVEIHSEVARGTTVTLTLPRARAWTAPPETTSLDPDSTMRALTILVVEDNIKVAEVAAAILQEHGHRVATAPSADDALAALEEGHGYDFVFTDLVMPGDRNGLDLAHTIRRRWPKVPVLLATGYSEAATRATQEGFPLLPKPYRASTLVATITRIAAEAESGAAGSGTPPSET